MSNESSAKVCGGCLKSIFACDVQLKRSIFLDENTFEAIVKPQKSISTVIHLGFGVQYLLQTSFIGREE